MVRRELVWWNLIGAGLAIAGGAGLRAWGYAAWLPWTALALAAMALHLGLLWRMADDNRPADQPFPDPTLGAANRITVSRGVLNSLVAGFIVAPVTAGGLSWLVAAIYTVSALSDIADGIVARRSGRMTLLGNRLDMEYDALGVLIVAAWAVMAGKVPLWFLGLGVARYAFVAGLWWRRRQNRPIASLTPSHNRRVAAGMIMGFLSVLIWPIAQPPATTVAGYGFGVPFALIFLRDWLVVSCRLDPANGSYRAVRHAAHLLAQRVLPLVARAGALLLWFGGVIGPQPGWLVVWGGLAVAALGVGIIGRLAALAVIATAVFAGLVAGSYELPVLLLLLCGVVVASFGSGRPALWSPEERIFEGRL
jgi:CDP-diacylglycerol--glycerol-3-phosphate 3-phosphatidyltransferase